MNNSLPRLAVISDVAVERTLSGSLVLFRLLRDYPPERLFVCDSDVRDRGDPDLGLRNVETYRIKYARPRINRTRWNPIGPALQIRSMKSIDENLVRRIEDFRPEAVLTVSHDYMWTVAARYARIRNIPLHMIIHDDWETQMLRRRGWTSEITRLFIRRSLKKAYRQAAGRFCVSPGMRETYKIRYGVDGSVLYPNRGDDSPIAINRVTKKIPNSPPAIAFAGSLYTDGACELLRKVADIMVGKKGYLDLYTKSPKSKLAELGLTQSSVRLMGFDPDGVPADQIAKNADLLFLPGSFRRSERTDVSTLFPSKLVDYTAIGLPILICSPSYSSAYQWGVENRDAVSSICTDDSQCISNAIQCIFDDKSSAQDLANRAIEVGNRDFSLSSATKQFYQSLRHSVGANCDADFRYN